MRRTFILAIAAAFALAGAAPAAAEAPDGFPGGNARLAVHTNIDGQGAGDYFDIITMHPDGTGRTNLTDNPSFDRHPVWSPDGASIAFISDRDGGSDVWMMDADGSNQRRVTDLSPLGAWKVTWAPDGTRLALEAMGSSLTSAIYVVNVDGTGLTEIVGTPGVANENPVWAPDGSAIAFTSFRGGFPPQIWLTDPDGSNQRQLLSHPFPTLDLDWAPGSDQLVFVDYDGGAFETHVYVVNADGTGATEIHDEGATVAWSPNGARIAVGTDAGILMMSPTGSDQQLVGLPADGHPDWQRLGYDPDLCNGLTPTIVGTAGNDVLFGTQGEDVIAGMDGDDVIHGRHGDDVICGGPGDDALFGEAGRDTLSYHESPGPIAVYLGGRQASGAAGTDTLRGFEVVVGSTFGDVLVGNALPNELRGGPGDDVLQGKGGHDLLFGGFGDDVLNGRSGDDLLDGGPDADLASFARSRHPVEVDVRNGWAVGDGNDLLVGIENLTGSRWDDTLRGDAGANTIRGGRGDDVLKGAFGDDVLRGNRGIDFARGGPGVDFCRAETRWNCEL